MPESASSRRELLSVGAGGILIALSGAASAEPPDKIDPEKGVTAPEDLMKEHGVLNRCLLIYEEGLRRLEGMQEVTPGVFHHTAQLIKKFVEEYHEKNEEKYIFPAFERARKLTGLV